MHGNDKQINNEGILMLSILIPTIPGREAMFYKLFMELSRQVSYCRDIHYLLGLVEVVVNKGESYLDGGLSIGKKRQALVEKSSGKYLCFLDDDDSIAPNYVEALLRLCNEDRDVCCFRNISKLDNYWCVIDMSLENENAQTSPDEVVLRKPWHICPVRSEYAKAYPFDDISYGEDWTWFERVLTHCTDQAKANAVLHQYNHSTAVSEADRIVKSQTPTK